MTHSINGQKAMSAFYIQHRQLNDFLYPYQPLQRDPDLWIFDGNVVLVAQGVAFRVHKGVLALHSDVFKLWFAGPAPLVAGYGATELFEGVPVVRLRASDTAYDLKQALLVTYGLKKLDDPSELNISVVSAVRRFAFAYGMQALAATSLHLFASTFSANLEDWDMSDEDCLAFDLGATQAIEAFNVLRLEDAGGYYAAVYRCAQLPEEVLQSGTRRADGTPEVLGGPDLCAILKAKAELRRYGGLLLSECRETRACGGIVCQERGCEDAFYGLRYPEDPVVERFANGDIACKWAVDCIDGLRDEGRICEECARGAMERHQTLRKMIWEEFVYSIEVPKEWK